MSIVRIKESHNHPVNIKRTSRHRYDTQTSDHKADEEYDEEDEDYEYMIEEDLNVTN